MLILFLVLFFLLQALVLFCCLAAGNDPASQQISDPVSYTHLTLPTTIRV